MRFSSFFASCVLTSVLFLIPYRAFSNTHYIVDSTSKFTNGSLGHVMDGDDMLSITPRGRIQIGVGGSDGHAVIGSGDRNRVRNEGILEGGAVLLQGDDNHFENLGHLENIGSGQRSAIMTIYQSNAPSTSNSAGSVIKNKKTVVARSVPGFRTYKYTDARAVLLGRSASFVNEEGGSVIASTIGAPAVALNIGYRTVPTPLLGGIQAYESMTAQAPMAQKGFLSRNSYQSSSVLNAGSFEAEVQDKGSAIGIEDSIGSDIINSGSISVKSISENSFAAGIRLTGSLSSARVTNEVSGRIVVRGEAGDPESLVFGIQQTHHASDALIINKGLIDISSPGGIVHGLGISGARSKVLLVEKSTLKATGVLASAAYVTAPESIFEVERGAEVRVESEAVSALIFKGSDSSVILDGNIDVIKSSTQVLPGSTRQTAVVSVLAPNVSVSVGKTGSIRGVAKGDSNLVGIELTREAPRAKISLAGKLQVEGETKGFVSGIELGGEDNVLTIEPSGQLDVVVKVPGSKSVSGVNAIGINPLIENKGRVALSLSADAVNGGASGSAVTLNTPRARLVNSGEIVSDSRGVSILEDAHIWNKGTIKSLGSNVCAICLEDSQKRLTLVNSGKVEGSSATGTAAIDLKGAGDLYFQQGTILGGDVILNQDGNNIYIDGRGRHSHWLFKGKGSIEGGRPVVTITEDQIALYSEDGREVVITYRPFRSSSGFLMSGSPLSVLNSFQASRSLLRNRRFGLLDSSAEGGLSLWGSGYRSQGAPYWELPAGLLALGFDKAFGSGGNWILGGLFGYSGNQKSQEDESSQSLDSKFMFGARALGRPLYGMFVDAVWLVGVGRQQAIHSTLDSTYGSGIQPLEFSRDNYWVSPGVTLGADLEFAGWRFRPSVYASFTAAMVPAYKKESPSLSIEYGDQNFGFVVGNAELEVLGNLGKLDLGVYGGYQYLQPWTSSVSLKYRGVENVIGSESLPSQGGFYGGLNLSVSIGDNASLTTGIRVLGDGSNRLSNIEGGVTLSMNF